MNQTVVFKKGRTPASSELRAAEARSNRYPQLRVDSLKPHCYDADDQQLQQWLLLSIVVAGKTARHQQVKLEAFLQRIIIDTMMPANCRFTPLRLIQLFGEEEIEQRLRLVKMGQYSRIAKAISQVARAVEARKTLNLRTCTAADLEAIHGIGPKTARFFLLYTRRDYRAAVLDTHILAWMREHHSELALPKRFKIPKSTPTGKTYARLEVAFLNYCDAHGLKPADFDFEVWRSRNRGDKNNGN